eukprot:5310478-Prymnesium_polylepis.1
MVVYEGEQRRGGGTARRARAAAFVRGCARATRAICAHLEERLVIKFQPTPFDVLACALEAVHVELASEGTQVAVPPVVGKHFHLEADSIEDVHRVALLAPSDVF